jgi:predicted enzyme related to lactoylglutathione lyase
VQAFYSEVFGWNFVADPVPDAKYVTRAAYPGSDTPVGGIVPAADASGNHAIFYILVEDVAATVAAR